MNFLIVLLIVALVLVLFFLMSQSGGSKPIVTLSSEQKQNMKRMSLYSEAVVGIRRKNPDGSRRQDIICTLREGDPIQLYRDPNNAKDPNAIEVHSKKGQIGFIKAFRAEELAPQMDKGYPTECTVKKLLPSRDKEGYGVVINIQRYKPAP